MIKAHGSLHSAWLLGKGSETKSIFGLYSCLGPGRAVLLRIVPSCLMGHHGQSGIGMAPVRRGWESPDHQSIQMGPFAILGRLWLEAKVDRAFPLT